MNNQQLNPLKNQKGLQHQQRSLSSQRNFELKQGQRRKFPGPVQRIKVPNSFRTTQQTQQNLPNQNQLGNRYNHQSNVKYLNLKRSLNQNQRRLKLNRTHSNFTRNKAPYSGQQIMNPVSFRNTASQQQGGKNLHEIAEFYLTPLQKVQQKRGESEYFQKEQSSTQKNGLKLPKKFYYNLAVELRAFYEHKTDFQTLFKEFDVATYCLNEIAEKVKCYRFQLGSVVTKVGSLFHGIFEKSLHTNLRLIKKFRDKIEQKLKTNIEGLEQLEIEKRHYIKNNKQLKSVLELQNSEVKIYLLQIESLNSEVVLLRGLLKKDVNLAQTKQLTNIDQEVIDLANNQDGNYDPAGQLEGNLGTLRGFIKNIEMEQENKKKLLGSMNTLLKEMLRGQKRTVATQVDEAQLEWTPELIVSPGNPAQTTQDSSSVNISSTNQNKQVYDNMEILDQQAKNAAKKLQSDSMNNKSAIKRKDTKTYIHPGQEDK